MPNIYQVWQLYKIILAMQTGGQNKHSEMPCLGTGPPVSD